VLLDVFVGFVKHFDCTPVVIMHNVKSSIMNKIKFYLNNVNYVSLSLSSSSPIARPPCSPTSVPPQIISRVFI